MRSCTNSTAGITSRSPATATRSSPRSRSSSRARGPAPSPTASWPRSCSRTSSTRRARRPTWAIVGWHALLDEHRLLVRRDIERFRGRELATTGDGFLASFDGPARAVRCAQAIVQAASALGLGVRAGVHAGEFDLRENDASGLTVHIASRVANLAGAGEVLTSSTVKDLLAGSGIEFEARGEHELKGVPDTWRLFAARA